MTQPTGEFLELQAALAGEYSLQRELGRGGMGIVYLARALAPTGSSDAAVLEKRRAAASARLAETVASLEGIRLDLLRLHAGAGDLAPLTTLIDAARLLGEDVSRLAEAQREVDAATVRRPLGSGRIPTPG